MSLRRFWSRLFARESRRSPLGRGGFRLSLERLEERTLLAVNLLFDAPAGTLAILGDGQDHTVREALGPAGFLEVAVDGQQHSGDLASASFDPALASATGSTLAGIRFDGPGNPGAHPPLV
jgi:hypothetical protein